MITYRQFMFQYTLCCSVSNHLTKEIMSKYILKLQILDIWRSGSIYSKTSVLNKYLLHQAYNKQYVILSILTQKDLNLVLIQENNMLKLHKVYEKVRIKPTNTIHHVKCTDSILSILNIIHRRLDIFHFAIKTSFLTVFLLPGFYGNGKQKKICRKIIAVGTRRQKIENIFVALAVYLAKSRIILLVESLYSSLI